MPAALGGAAAMMHLRNDRAVLPPVAESTLRRVLRWALYIETQDEVRRTLNRGLQLVILGLTGLVLASLVRGVISWQIDAAVLICLILMPINAAAFWLTRRGGVGGAVLIVLFTAIGIAAGFIPATYADPPIIHTLFLLPGLIATLFITPWLGFPVALLQMLLLALHIVSDGLPASVAYSFLFIGTVNLWAITLPIALSASLFRRSIHSLTALTARLDAQVSERTSELRRLMALRESDIAAIVHDIRNSMTVVHAEMEDLLAEVHASGVELGGLGASERRVSAAVRSVGDLVEDLRTAVQLDNAALQLQHDQVDLEELTRRVVGQLSTPAAQSGCRLSVEVADAPAVVGDERKLERVLNNLVGNAIKYCRQMPADSRMVAVRVEPTGGGTEVRIIDTGPGLSAEALQILGQPFTRLASSRGTDGMGLGVYISRGIVELHGGRLSFSSPGESGGTTVTIWLPAEADV